MSDLTAAPLAPRRDPAQGRLWRLAVVLGFGGVMAGLDTSIVSIGIAAIGGDLDASLATVQWVHSAYLLAVASTLPLCGWTTRQLGAGRLWLWSLAAFTVTSGLCALAPDVGLLITFRILQGMAGGFLLPCAMTVLAEIAGPARMGRVMATTSIPAILAPAVGPAVGAILISQLSWHWLFLINLPVGTVGLLLGLRLVPRGALQAGRRPDLVAMVLVVLGLPALTYTVSGLAEQRQLATPGGMLPPVLAVATLSAFGYRSWHSRSPLLDLKLFCNRIYRAAAAEIFFNGAALFGGLIIMPLYFQILLNHDVLHAGLLLIAFSIGAAATFPLAGRLTDHHGGGRVATGGLLITAVTTAPFAFLPPDSNLVLVEGLQVLRGAGLALSGLPVISTALAAVERHQLPDASAQVSVLSRVGGAIGSAAFVSFLSARLPAEAADVAATAAFHRTFGWLTLVTIAAVLGSAWLTHEQRRLRPSASPPTPDELNTRPASRQGAP